MKYFKNTELARLYNISEKSVRNWIDAAQQGKLGLILHKKGSKSYISDNTKNIAAIEKLVEKGRKYRNTRGLKTITPRPEFYKLYDQKQLFDIVSNLDIHHEIPRQYNYFDGGAEYWDKYANRLALEGKPNMLTNTVELLSSNQGRMDDLLSKYDRVNVIDIGVGNALPVRDLLGHLTEQKILGRYIAIDISAKMIRIAKRNVEKWFGKKVAFEGHVRDLNYERFTDILAQEYVGQNSQKTANLVLVLGGTLGNLRSPDAALKVIHDSMSRNDILIISQKLDTKASRRFFDFNIESGVTTLAPNHRFIFDLLNIDPSFYDVEMDYDEEKRQRFIRVKLKVALTINFEFDNGKRSIELHKDDTILLWRYWHQDMLGVMSQLFNNGFDLLHASLTDDKEFLLSLSQIKSE